jgi:hypothetical protein
MLVTVLGLVGDGFWKNGKKPSKNTLNPPRFTIFSSLPHYFLTR